MHQIAQACNSFYICAKKMFQAFVWEAPGANRCVLDGLGKGHHTENHCLQAVYFTVLAW